MTVRCVTCGETFEPAGNEARQPWPTHFGCGGKPKPVLVTVGAFSARAPVVEQNRGVFRLGRIATQSSGRERKRMLVWHPEPPIDTRALAERHAKERRT